MFSGVEPPMDERSAAANVRPEPPEPSPPRAAIRLACVPWSETEALAEVDGDGDEGGFETAIVGADADLPANASSVPPGAVLLDALAPAA